MILKKLDYNLTVCKVQSMADIDFSGEIFFVGKTKDEISLVCKTESTPKNTIAKEDGFKGFYISGTLDFSLVGILSKISAIMAQNNIGIFAVSTYNTDYILVKAQNFERALKALSDNGYIIE